MHLHIQMWVVGSKPGGHLFSFFTSGPHGWKRGWQEELLGGLSHQGCSCIAPGKQHPFESQQEAGTMAGCLALGKHKFPGCEEAPPPALSLGMGCPIPVLSSGSLPLPTAPGKGAQPSLPSPSSGLDPALPNHTRDALGTTWCFSIALS